MPPLPDPVTLTNPLPLLLAGPILRGTDAQSVTVWVALSENSTVTLQVYEMCDGRLHSSFSGGRPVEDHRAQLGPLQIEGQRQTLQLGTHLHIAAITAQAQTALLQPGQIYAYNLCIVATQQTVDLRSEAVQQQGSLSYFDHQLPTFALPPAEVQHLKIVHGSCRKPHGGGPDILPVLDDLLAQDADNPNQRPHQLFLTGDQIYGDDVADPFLWMALRLSPKLMGWEEFLPVDRSDHDVDLYSPKLWPPGQRTEIARQKCGFTAMLHNKPEAAKSHLFSFTEYCMAYLLAWSPVLWPDAAQILAAKPRRASRQWGQDAADMQTFVHGAQRVRRVLANIPTYMICDDHDVTDDWYLNREWCDRVLSKPLGRSVVQNALLAYALFQAWGNTPEQFSNPSGAALLQTVEQWCAAKGKDECAWQTIGKLLGVPMQNKGHPQMQTEQTVDVLQQDPQALSWSYTVRSACHEVLVLDTRTWRGYPKDTKAIAPPMLLCPSAFKHQIVDPLQHTDRLNEQGANIQTTFVVLPTNLVSLSIIDRVQEWDWQRGKVFSNDVGDAWNFHEVAFTRLMNTLNAHRDRIVILSGDIHYGCTVRLDYCARTAETLNKSTLVQLTSSAMKNAEFATYLVHTRLKSLFPEADESWLGWQAPPDAASTQPGQQQTPIWQKDGSTKTVPVNSQPDWYYQISWIPRQPTQSTALLDTSHWRTSRSFSQSFKRAISWLWRNRWFQEGSEVVGHNNFGVVTWADEATAIHHDIYWYPPWNMSRPVTSQYTVDLTQEPTAIELNPAVNSTCKNTKEFG